MQLRIGLGPDQDGQGAEVSTRRTLSAATKSASLARERGAHVVFGGIHATQYPNEAHELGGAHAVVKGDGDVVWSSVLADCFGEKPQPIYEGGRVETSSLLTILVPSLYFSQTEPTDQRTIPQPERSVWLGRVMESARQSLY